MNARRAARERHPGALHEDAIEHAIALLETLVPDPEPDVGGEPSLCGLISRRPVCATAGRKGGGAAPDARFAIADNPARSFSFTVGAPQCVSCCCPRVTAPGSQVG